MSSYGHYTTASAAQQSMLVRRFIFRKSTKCIELATGHQAHKLLYWFGSLRIKWKLQCFFINYLQLHTNSSAHPSTVFTSFAPFTGIWSQCSLQKLYNLQIQCCLVGWCRLHHQIGIKFNENGSTKMLSGNVKTFSCRITNFLSKECRQTKCGSSEMFGISCKRLVDTFAQRVRFVCDVMMAEQSDYINIRALFAGNER